MAISCPAPPAISVRGGARRPDLCSLLFIGAPVPAPRTQLLHVTGSAFQITVYGFTWRRERRGRPAAGAGVGGLTHRGGASSAAVIMTVGFGRIIVSVTELLSVLVYLVNQ